MATSAVIAVGAVLIHNTVTYGLSERLDPEEAATVDAAIGIVGASGLKTEEDWLRRSAIRRPRAWYGPLLGPFYAAAYKLTLSILVSDLFFRALDDTERAVTLVHEQFHLRLRFEHGAYAATWPLKERLGLTREAYGQTAFWCDLEANTRLYAPELFR